MSSVAGRGRFVFFLFRSAIRSRIQRSANGCLSLIPLVSVVIDWTPGGFGTTGVAVDERLVIMYNLGLDKHLGVLSVSL